MPTTHARIALPLLTAGLQLACLGQGEPDSASQSFDLVGNPRVAVPLAKQLSACSLEAENCLLVTNTDDSGKGSLRYAMIQADAMAGHQFIGFDIPGKGPHTIELLSPLPEVSEVTISGYSQPGAVMGTATVRPSLQVWLTGTHPGEAAVQVGYDAVVAGLVITGGWQYGIEVVAEGVVVGNAIGVFPLGLSIPSDAPVVGVGVTSLFLGESQIGGPLPWQANVISAVDRGVFVQGWTAGYDRVVIEGNRIGTDYFGTSDFGRGGSAGIHVERGAASAVRNIVAHMGGLGIQADQSFVGGNEFSENSLFDNQGLGIGWGPTLVPNDAGDVALPQNFPFLTQARVSTNGVVTLDWLLSSAPSTVYRVELFESDACDPSGYGEGERYVGSQQVTTNSAGLSVRNSWVLPATVQPGDVLTATATNLDTLTTSEFSACLVVPE